MPWHMWRPEDTSQESVLSFYLVSPGVELGSSGFCGKCLYPLRHLAGLLPHFLASHLSPASLYALLCKRVTWYTWWHKLMLKRRLQKVTSHLSTLVW